MFSALGTFRFFASSLLLFEPRLPNRRGSFFLGTYIFQDYVGCRESTVIKCGGYRHLCWGY